MTSTISTEVIIINFSLISVKTFFAHVYFQFGYVLCCLMFMLTYFSTSQVLVLVNMRVLELIFRKWEAQHELNDRFFFLNFREYTYLQWQDYVQIHTQSVEKKIEKCLKCMFRYTDNFKTVIFEIHYGNMDFEILCNQTCSKNEIKLHV